MSRRIGKGLSELLANIEDERVQMPSEFADGEAIYQIDIEKSPPTPISRVSISTRTPRKNSKNPSRYTAYCSR